MKKRMMLVILCGILILQLTGCKMMDYNKAEKLQKEGNYTEALTLYERIEDYENYKDTAEQVKICKNMISAIEKYEVAKKELEQKNSDIENLIKESEDLIAKKETALDDSLIPALETSISETKSIEIDVPKMPEKEPDILKTVSTMQTIDYSEATTNLTNSKAALEKSIKQYALVNQPTEAYVIQCLKNVKHVANISAVTEDNDPNGNLNKPGGYTATVYYADNRIKLDSSIYGKTVIDQGTQGGGAVEVYATVEDAEKRRDYLAIYDGTRTASGTHTVVGTVLVRTSDELAASKQKKMEKKIIEALTYVGE